ncbi:unnamed protein product [Arabidopsis halleri]
MKVLSWNCQGLGNKATIGQIFYFFRKQNNLLLLLKNLSVILVTKI